MLAASRLHVRWITGEHLVVRGCGTHKYRPTEIEHRRDRITRATRTGDIVLWWTILRVSFRRVIQQMWIIRVSSQPHLPISARRQVARDRRLTERLQRLSDRVWQEHIRGKQECIQRID